MSDAAARMREVRRKRSNSHFNGDPEFRHPELLVIPQIRFNCVLCGIGISESYRVCQLHPDICTDCHEEYCECHGITDDVASIEQIAAIANEEKRVPLLKARKDAIRNMPSRP